MQNLETFFLAQCLQNNGKLFLEAKAIFSISTDINKMVGKPLWPIVSKQGTVNESSEWIGPDRQTDVSIRETIRLTATRLCLRRSGDQQTNPPQSQIHRLFLDSRKLFLATVCPEMLHTARSIAVGLWRWHAYPWRPFNTAEPKFDHN